MTLRALCRAMSLCLLGGVLASGCGREEAPPPASPGNLTAELLDTSAVERFWEIQDRLASGVPVDDDAWDALFATPAFRWHASDEETRKRTRQRMELAFQPDRAPVEAEAARAEGYAAILWQHYLRIRDDREALAIYHAELKSSRVIEDALAIAQQALPSGIVKPQEWSTPVRLLFFGPDAFAGDDAIYLDLVQARGQDQNLAHLLAHEFHHDYYDRVGTLAPLDEDSPWYWIVHAVRQLHMEGTADRIDKQQYPIQQRRGDLPGYADEYNRYYRETPQTLAQFDAALIEIARAGEGAEIAREAWRLFHYGAHPEGFFMANTIARAQGPEALIEDLGDPFAFVRRFQSVSPVFSDDALALLARVEADTAASEQKDPPDPTAR